MPTHQRVPRQSIFTKTALALGIAFTLAASAHATQDQGKGFHWGERDKGWFFYNEERPVERKEPQAPPPPPPPSTAMNVTPPPAPAPAPAEEAGPAPLSAEWFRENLPKYEDAAWDNPTPENVQTYFMLQRYVMDRSEEFANVAQLVNIGNPWLDETTRRPMQSAASRQLTVNAVRNRNQALEDLAETVGVFYFYDSQCEACAHMQDVVRMIDRTFAVVPISMDGKDLPGNPYPNFQVDQGHAQRFGVQRGPALFLVSPNGEATPFANAPISLNDARERMIMAAYREGWISQKDFFATRPLRNQDRSLTEALKLDDLMADDEGNESNFIPPEKLLPRIQDGIDNSGL